MGRGGVGEVRAAEKGPRCMGRTLKGRLTGACVFHRQKAWASRILAWPGSTQHHLGWLACLMQPTQTKLSVPQLGVFCEEEGRPYAFPSATM